MKQTIPNIVLCYDSEENCSRNEELPWVFYICLENSVLHH